MNVLPIQNKKHKKKKAHKHMKNVNLLSSQLPNFWKEPSFSRPQNSTLLVTFDSLKKIFFCGKNFLIGG